MKHWLLLGVLAGCAIESPPPERYEGAPQSPAVAEDPPAVARVVQAAVFGPFDSGAGTTLSFETKHPGDTLLFTVEFEGPGYPGVVHVGEDTAYQWGVSSHGCTDGARLVFAASSRRRPRAS